jgi:hypothetical protein
VLRIRDVLSRIRIPDPDPGSGSKKFFYIPGPGSYMKSGMQTYFFLASFAFRRKVLAFVVVQKIRDPAVSVSAYSTRTCRALAFSLSRSGTKTTLFTAYSEHHSKHLLTSYYMSMLNLT